jgi:hypothetical protein
MPHEEMAVGKQIRHPLLDPLRPAVLTLSGRCVP